MKHFIPLAFVLCTLSSCSESSNAPASDSVPGSSLEKHALDSLQTRRYAGTYCYGTDSAKEPTGFMLVYPETDTSVIFHIEVFSGPPENDQGVFTDAVAINKDTGLLYFALDTSGTECKLRFRFEEDKLVTITVPEFSDWWFGPNVSFDQVFTRTSKVIPEYYIDNIGDTSRFDRIIWWNNEVRMTGKMPLDYGQDSVTKIPVKQD